MKYILYNHDIYIYICEIIKAICLPSYHDSGFVVTHALGHIMHIHILYEYTYINIYRHIYIFL